MKEFIDKLIGRLEEEKNKFVGMYTDYAEGLVDAYENSLEIVNGIAEEYKEKEYCWQTCGATEHCKECRRLGNGDIDYYESIGEYINTSTEHINCSTDTSTKLFGNSEQVNGGWIPCSERLPKQNEEVLASLLVNGKPLVMEITYDHTWLDDDLSKLIAWMPLPAPYTEGE